MEPPDRKKRILLALMAAAVPVGFMGIFFWPILKNLGHARQQGGGGRSNAPLLIVGGFFLVMVLAVVVSVVRGIRKLSNSDSAVASPRDPKPWLARADWAAGRIKSSTAFESKFLLLWSVLALAMSAPAVLAIPNEWQKGNHLILLVLLFPVVAFYLLALLGAKWRAHRRYGDCFFEITSIPAPLGGSLAGMIQTGARLRLEHGLKLKLSCIRRTVSGSGDNRNTSEHLLWQDEKVYKNEADLPEPEPGHSGIPVHFKIPANQPECSAHGNEAIFWRLEAKAKMSGPDFSASFDVPVFKVADAAGAGAEEPDPTAVLQMSAEEIRRDENSRICVTDGPDGREFYFPAARNPGAALTLTIAFLVFGGFAVAARLLFHSLFFEIVCGLVTLLLFFGCLNLWFKSSRIKVNSSGLTSVNRWLLFTRTRRFDAGEIEDFGLKIGMTSGNQAYYTLKLIPRGSAESFAKRKARYQQTGERPPLKFGITDPSGVTLAGGIASKPEADWLVREMNHALGRRL